MDEDERKEEAEKARRAKEDRESGQQNQQQPENAASRPSVQNKGWHCPTCGTGFTTKGNMFKHIRTFHEAHNEQKPAVVRGNLEEEPVTFETFKKFFSISMLCLVMLCKAVPVPAHGTVPTRE